MFPADDQTTYLYINAGSFRRSVRFSSRYDITGQTRILICHYSAFSATYLFTQTYRYLCLFSPKSTPTLPFQTPF